MRTKAEELLMDYRIVSEYLTQLKEYLKVGSDNAEKLKEEGERIKTGLSPEPVEEHLKRYHLFEKVFTDNLQRIVNCTGLSRKAENISLKIVNIETLNAITIHSSEDNSYAIGIDKSSTTHLPNLLCRAISFLKSRDDEEQLRTTLALHESLLSTCYPSFKNKDEPPQLSELFGSLDRYDFSLAMLVWEFFNEFIIAHELGHIALGHFGQVDVGKDVLAKQYGFRVSVFKQGQQYEADKWAISTMYSLAGDSEIYKIGVSKVPKLTLLMLDIIHGLKSSENGLRGKTRSYYSNCNFRRERLIKLSRNFAMTKSGEIFEETLEALDYIFGRVSYSIDGSRGINDLSKLLSHTVREDLTNLIKKSRRAPNLHYIFDRLPPRKALVSTIAMVDLATEYSMQGRMRDAERLIKEGIERFKNIGGTEREQATCYMNLGDIYIKTGQYDEAGVCFEKALVRSKKLRGTGKIQASCKMNLGIVYEYTRQHKLSEMFFKEAYEEFQDVAGCDRERLDCLLNIGMLYLTERKYGNAETLLEKAIDGYRKLADTEWHQGNCMLGLAEIYLETKRNTEAQSYADASLKILQRTEGAELLQAEALIILGNSYLRQEEVDRAKRCLDVAETICNVFQELSPAYDETVRQKIQALKISISMNASA